MKPFELNFCNVGNHDTIYDLARDLALVACGLLGDVDKFWTQHILNGHVKMSFSDQGHRDQFGERWASLNQADWYNACATRSIADEVDEGEAGPLTMNPHTYVAHIPWKTQFAEGDEIENALKARGFVDTHNFDLTEISLQSKLIKLDGFAVKCGVENFESIELEDDDENECTPIILSSSNLKQLAAFKLAIDLTGGI